MLSGSRALVFHTSLNSEQYHNRAGANKMVTQFIQADFFRSEAILIFVMRSRCTALAVLC
jgi:hypothetical protein